MDKTQIAWTRPVQELFRKARTTGRGRPASLSQNGECAKPKDTESVPFEFPCSNLEETEPTKHKVNPGAQKPVIPLLNGFKMRTHT